MKIILNYYRIILYVIDFFNNIMQRRLVRICEQRLKENKTLSIKSIIIFTKLHERLLLSAENYQHKFIYILEYLEHSHRFKSKAFLPF